MGFLTVLLFGISKNGATPCLVHPVSYLHRCGHPLQFTSNYLAADQKQKGGKALNLLPEQT